MSFRLSPAILIASLTAVIACSAPDRTADPRSTSDGGAGADAGHGVDGGPGADGGSGADAGPGTDGGSTVAQGAFAATFSEALCSRVFDCCTLAEVKEVVSSSITDEASCRTLEASQVGYWTMIANTSRAHFDEQAAAQCVAFARGAECRAFSLSQPAGSEVCNELVVGQQTSGSPCASSQECVSRLCTGIPLDINGDPSGDGTCQNPAAEGQPCAISMDENKFNDGAPCQAGSFESWSGGSCSCASRLANTDPCENSSDCASNYCNNSNRCADQSTAPMVCSLTR